MPQRIQVPINGITTTSAYQDGDTFSLVNLRPKNGALHPVSPRKVVQELSQEYDIVFVHQNNDYKNWIGITTDGSYSSAYWDILSEQPKTIQSYIQGKIHSVQQIGNTLSFITDNNIYYAWYTDYNYVYLDELPQIPAIEWGVKNQSTATYYYTNEYGSNTITPDNFIDSTKGLVNKAMDALVNGYTDKDGVWHDGFGLQLFDAYIVRYAYRLYDGTLTKHSPLILLMSADDILSIKKVAYRFWDGTLEDESYVRVKGYKAALAYDFTLNGDYNRWKDIITSVDIFLSAPIGISNIENIRKDMPTNNHNPSQGGYNYDIIKEISGDNLKQVTNTSSFYLIRSIPLGKSSDILNPDEFPTQESDITKMENLIYQEVMSDDNFTNHKYGASVSYAYNNRLHIAGIKTTFFNGFNPSYFNYSTNYNGVEIVSGNVNGLLAEVEIEAGATLQKVYSYYSIYSFSPKLFSSALISYPDSRAKRMTIYEKNGDIWTRIFAVPLEKHNLLNLSYFINDGLKPIIGSNLGNVDIPNTSQAVILSEPNKIKVSDLNNPLRFPNENTYLTGNGIILAMATNAMNVSDRNYGQYPLYIFTTQGIWNLNVGSDEVVYSTQSAPTSTEAPINSIVESTPFGVVFVSARGLMIINGQNTTFISPQIEQPYKKIEQETNVKIEELLHTFEKQTFSEYLKNLSTLVYDPYQNELIVCNKQSGFNYVLNFYIKSFYQSTEIIESVVKNTFPDLYVIGKNKLKYYLESETKRTHVSFMLRPFTYGNESTKWLQNVKIPFTLYGVERMFIGIYASSDNVKFPGRYGKFYEAMNRAVSYDTKTIASNTGRYFLLSFAAILDDDSYLDIIDSEVTTKYNNM
ncbi:MAG: hypothetical protein QM660_08890 [Dysgonomonas sp.]